VARAVAAAAVDVAAAEVGEGGGVVEGVLRLTLVHLVMITTHRPMPVKTPPISKMSKFMSYWRIGYKPSFREISTRRMEFKQSLLRTASMFTTDSSSGVPMVCHSKPSAIAMVAVDAIRMEADA